jgi:ATP-dependent Clp protease, protease subunit
MEGNIFIKGEIGEEVNLVDIISQVENQKEATMFNVYINSVGGSVDVGFDIYNYLKSLNVPINTIGQEMVASIATVIFMAGTSRKLELGTEFMIHLPWGSVSGTSQEIEQYNEMLKKYEKKLVDFYTKATGLNDEAIRPLLTYETWLSPKLAQDLRFTTSIASDIPVLAKANFNFKPDNKMTDEQKGMFTKLFEKVDAIFSKVNVTVKNIVLQDANGVEVEFPDVAEGETPIVGESTATVDGQPAEGEYLMPDGQTYIFVGGVLTEIVEVQEDEQASKIAELEKQLADAKAEIEAKNAALTEASNVVATLKKEIKSSFVAKPAEKKEEKEVVSSAKSALENLKNKRRK